MVESDIAGKERIFVHQFIDLILHSMENKIALYTAEIYSFALEIFFLSRPETTLIEQPILPSTFFTPDSAKSKIAKFSKITNWAKLKNKQHRSKVLLNSFPTNGRTFGFCPQNQKLENFVSTIASLQVFIS